MTHFDGPYGRAEQIVLPNKPMAAATVCVWLISSRQFHPLWGQYVLSCVRLGQFDGLPEPYLRWEGATHELQLLTLNPEAGYVTQRRLDKKWVLPYLLPPNFCEQFTATDEEMSAVCALMANVVVDRGMTPEASDAPEEVAEMWLGSTVKTLAHLRGEEHAS